MASYRRYDNANPFNRDRSNKCRGDSDNGIPSPNFPTTLREVLLSLIGEQINITVPMDVVTGTLIAVRNDYVLLVESTGDQVLIRLDKIELVSEGGV